MTNPASRRRRRAQGVAVDGEAELQAHARTTTATGRRGVDVDAERGGRARVHHRRHRAGLVRVAALLAPVIGSSAHSPGPSVGFGTPSNRGVERPRKRSVVRAHRKRRRCVRHLPVEIVAGEEMRDVRAERAAVAFRSRHAPNASSRAAASVSASGYERASLAGLDRVALAPSIWPTNTGGEAERDGRVRENAADATVAAVCKRIAATAADF